MERKERDKLAERSRSPDLATSKMMVEEDKQQESVNKRFSAESQDFEFNKLLGEGPVSTSPARGQLMHEGGVQQLASADELFYKGQLLPLQYSCTRPPNNIIHSTPSSPRMIPRAFHETCIEIDPSPTKLHDSLSSFRDSDHVQRFSSCRMDHLPAGVMDSSLSDFTRSSSFRSHSSNYTSYYCNFHANYRLNPSNSVPWDSSTSTSATVTSGGESSGSSRDSNGSSQDSYSTSSDHTNKEQHPCCHSHLPAAGMNGPFASFCPKRKPGFMQSWKLLLAGFRRGSHSAAHNSSFHGSLNRDGALASPGLHQGAGGGSCGCKILSKEKSGAMHSVRSSMIMSKSTSLTRAQEKDQKGRGNGSRENECLCASCSNKKERRGSNMYARGPRWPGYTLRRIKPMSMIKATLGGGLHAENFDQDNAAGCMHNKSSEQQPAGDDQTLLLHKGRFTRAIPPSPSSMVFFRFHTVSSSCPASVRSSPNHSGLLASPAFNNNMSSMQELHSAVQGAIAHCKQSISSPSS